MLFLFWGSHQDEPMARGLLCKPGLASHSITAALATNQYPTTLFLNIKNNTFGYFQDSHLFKNLQKATCFSIECTTLRSRSQQTPPLEAAAANQSEKALIIYDPTYFPPKQHSSCGLMWFTLVKIVNNLFSTKKLLIAFMKFRTQYDFRLPRPIVNITGGKNQSRDTSWLFEFTISHSYFRLRNFANFSRQIIFLFLISIVELTSKSMAGLLFCSDSQSLCLWFKIVF